MSRPIKFRVWNSVDKKMSKPFTLDDFANDQDGESGDGYYSLRSYSASPPVEFPVMQLTGLFDRNGKEYCQGDWVKDEDGDVWELIYSEEDAAFLLDDHAGRYLNFAEFTPALYEIIGNIYENPELLKDSPNGR